MKSNLTALCLLFGLLYTDAAHASTQVVLASQASDIWYKRVYLMADRKSWMNYENFTVQIGDMGELVYHFPHWYHGKYEPALYHSDISGDKLEDVVVVLNNDRAGIGAPRKDIHVLNQTQDPCREYRESVLEPVSAALKRFTALSQQGSIVTVLAGKHKHSIDLSHYPFTNPRNPHFSVESVEYMITNGTLSAAVGLYTDRDDGVSGGYLGHLSLEYYWDGHAYRVQSVAFTKANPETVS